MSTALHDCCCTWQVLDRVKALEEKLKLAQQKSQELQEQSDTCERRLATAKELTGGLANEQVCRVSSTPVCAGRPQGVTDNLARRCDG